MSVIPVGLRIDVDTFRGTRDGIPALVNLFAKHNVKATFFMSVGPDNMGRHLWRLLKPRFLWKMLRSNAASLYGWDILLCGTAWPGPMIGDRLADTIRTPEKEGHEVGLHAWDHYSWQTHTDRFSPQAMEEQIRLGVDKLRDILGHAPTSSATAGWRCNEQTLLLKEKFPFAYNSDCRGTSLFCPVVNGKKLTPQIPATLPTYDELIGQNGITKDNYNDYILDQCKPGQLNVYTIHTEAEGGVLLNMFEQMLISAKQRGIAFQPLRDIVAAHPDIPSGVMIKKGMHGREGWLAAQG
jgi:undecaprenyl phosphate-alpha-L-ara4FN deformylase